MMKTTIVLLNLAFKCMLVNETCAIALMQAGMQAITWSAQLMAQAT